MTQRLWWALLLTAGCWGLLRVAEALNIGNPTSRVLIGAVAFALSPRVLTTLGSISSETLPMMLAPWVLLPVILALRGQLGRPLRVLAAGAGIGDRVDGGGQRGGHPHRMPARADLVGLPPAEPAVAGGSPRVVLASALAVTWWVIALVLLGRSARRSWTSSNRRVTTQWTSLTELLRGTDSGRRSWRPTPRRDRRW